jgi:hypothetical protein
VRNRIYSEIQHHGTIFHAQHCRLRYERGIDTFYRLKHTLVEICILQRGIQDFMNKNTAWEQ